MALHRTKRRIRVLLFVSVISLVILCGLWVVRRPRILFKACNITALDPWDEALKPYLSPPEPLSCSEKYELFYFQDDGNIHLNISMANKYGLDPESMSCSHQIIGRLNGDMKLKFGPKSELLFPGPVKGHIFRITCSQGQVREPLYDMTHFNPFWNEYSKQDARVEAESPDKPSVIVFGIDSVSRSHAIRNLPNSYEFLRKQLQSYDFIGYRKTGENTFPNLVPLLTGKSPSRFPHVEHLKMFADTMPFIWNEEALGSVATYFAEDRPDISAFNYGKGGFNKVPTDFYFRPYTLAFYEFEPMIKKGLGKPNYDCYGNRNYFQIEIDYLKGFLRKYNHKRKFAFFWSNQVGHEAFTTLSRGDEPLLEFLQWMKSHTDMSNTILIVLSDHGFRIGGASLTHTGRAENNNPWKMIHIPDNLKQLHPAVHSSLNQNSQRLVTHYDVYQTIYDLFQGNAFSKGNAPGTKKSLYRRNLFQKVPYDRTCVDAGIEDIFCTCKDKVIKSARDPLIIRLTKFLVANMNKLISESKNDCLTIRLLNITEASVVYSEKDDGNLHKELDIHHNIFLKFFGLNREVDAGTGRYTVLFFTDPGDAYFEGTVDYAPYMQGGDADQMTVIGAPVRLNRYGRQSHCVDLTALKPICYCKDLLTR